MISVSHLTALDASPEAFLDHAAAAGFDAVGLRIRPPKHTPDQWPVAGDRARTRALRRRADDLGIRIFEIEAFSVWPDLDVEDALPGLEAGAELGAEVLVAAGIDEDEDRLVASYDRLCEAASRFGLTVAVEFMPFRPLRSLADAVRVLRRIGPPNAALLVDTLHLARSGGTPAEVAELDRASIAYIHLCDAGPGPVAPSGFAEEARNSRLYPGEGVLPLAELLGLLPADVPVSLEAPNARHAHLPPEARLAAAARVTLPFVRACRTVTGGD